MIFWKFFKVGWSKSGPPEYQVGQFKIDFQINIPSSLRDSASIKICLWIQAENQLSLFKVLQSLLISSEEQKSQVSIDLFKFE